MKRAIFIFCFLLSASNLRAQFNFHDLAFLSVPPEAASSSFSPTNISGYPALAWYVGGDLYTNAGNGILPDRWTNSFHLTNTAGIAVPALNATGLNGLGTVTWDGSDDYLRSLNYTSTQPHEMVMVVKFLTNAGIARLIVNYSGTALSHAFLTSSDSVDMRAPSTFAPVVPITQNKWYVLNLIFNNTNSAIYTNNIALGTGGNTGTNGMNGMVVGARESLVVFHKLSIAEMITYGGGNAVPGTNTTTRSNLFYYLTNKYAITP